MVMLNDLDRYHLVIDVLDRVPGLGPQNAMLRQQMIDARLEARRYGGEHGEDPPEVAHWLWEGVAQE
jgi:xylulose-5-phosphate/fructose-6-phosphate phosphoketolase